MRVLVTGAGRGLGLEFTRQFLTRGDTVFATVRDPSRATALEALRGKGGKLRVFPLDISEPASIEELHGRVAGQTTAIDLLVNNAGISSGSRDFAERRPATQLGFLEGRALMRLFAVNAVGTMLVSQRFLDLLERGEQPRIVSLTSKIGSIADKTSGGNYGYAASKAALNMLMHTLANDVAPAGISVVVVHPGWVKTDMGGPQAILTVEESVRGIIALADRMGPAESGRFYDVTGAELKW
jgi:NAD(P)-dependent dehydrogenase (short-subunit alcohol dehydrogenase family)